MGHGWENLSVGGRIAAKLVGHELPGRPPLVFQHLAKEAFSGSLVSAVCDQDIEDISILVNGSPKIMAFAADCDEHFVHVVQPDGMADDLGWKAMTSIQGFHRSIVADRR